MTQKALEKLFVKKVIFLCFLRHWIRNPGVPCSEPLGGFKFDSACHPFEVDKMSAGNLAVKSKLLPLSGSSLEVVEPHPQKEVIQFFVF